MSCRPAVAQSTARSYVVRRLDDADHKLTLQKKARGQECLDKVRLYACRRCTPVAGMVSQDIL